MTKDTKRFRQTEKFLTYTLIAAFIIFIIYLISAGSGVLWLKTLSSIFIILICGLCLAFLKLANLLTRPKTLWMTTAAIAMIFSLLFSLILNFPSKL